MNQANTLRNFYATAKYQFNFITTSREQCYFAVWIWSHYNLESFFSRNFAKFCL